MGLIENLKDKKKKRMYYEREAMDIAQKTGRKSMNDYEEIVKQVKKVRSGKETEKATDFNKLAKDEMDKRYPGGWSDSEAHMDELKEEKKKIRNKVMKQFEDYEYKK